MNANAERENSYIHLIFKTHLDIGFTDYAQNIRRQYHDFFFPMAIRTGEHLWHENPERPQFIWTTGAWLIHDHLEIGTPEQRRALEVAIERGLISWHALPYTSHTELLSPDLFRAGLGFAADLDRRFGCKTTGAKMTDVPGHTLGIVPLLAEAGVRFLHLGVNAASTPPSVPPVFRWRASGGEEVVVMYLNDYGKTYVPDGMSQGIAFAHAQDNVGPPGVAQTIEIYRQINEEYPGANFRASTLTDYGDILWEHRQNFPIVEQEIGDTWIHGVGTAPQKVSRFMSLRRLFEQWAQEDLSPRRTEMGRRLGMVAEHTWGVDCKTYLRNEEAWDRADFEKARILDPSFKLSEHSWREQEALVDEAISALDDVDRREAETEARLPDVVETQGPFERRSDVELGQGRLSFDEHSGALTQIHFPNGGVVQGQGGELATLSYESYDARNMQAYMDGYLTLSVYWAVQDQGKPGLERASTAVSDVFRPEIGGLAQPVKGAVTSKFRYSAIAAEQLGAPKNVEIHYEFEGAGTLEVTVC